MVMVAHALLLSAQQRTITGRVTTSEDGKPFPGASVRVVGSTAGVQTDAQGQFTLVVNAEAKSLEFYAIGYVRQTKAINAKKCSFINSLPILSHFTLIYGNTGNAWVSNK